MKTKTRVRPSMWRRVQLSRQWQRAHMAVAAALLVGMNAIVLPMPAPIGLHEHAEQTRTAYERLLDASAVLFAAARGQKLVTVPPGGGGASGGFPSTHYGTAVLPNATPTYTSTNATIGTVHSPTTPAQLATLLAFGDIGSGVLAAGDTIRLARGTCYNNGTYVTQRFPVVTGASKTNPVRVITTGTASIALPDDRITIAQRHATPHFRCQLDNNPCIQLDYGATGWQFIGIQADAGSVASIYGVVEVGRGANAGGYSSGTTYAIGDITYEGWKSLQNGNVGHAQVEGAWWTRMALADLANEIVFDRCDFYAAYGTGCVVLMYVYCRQLVVVNSLLICEGVPTQEDKAFLCVTGSGPFLIENNRITSSCIPLLTGGANPLFDVQPDNCTVRRNWFYKPLEWFTTRPEWDGQERRCKNLFELKVGRRWLIEDNLFENDYENPLHTESQYFAIVFKTSNQDGGYTLAETANITFRFNRLKNIDGAFGLGAVDDNGYGVLDGGHDISIYHNYTETPCGTLNPDGGRSWCMQISGQARAAYRPRNIHFEHNTIIGDHPRVGFRMMAQATDTTLIQGLVWRNDIVDFGQYGLAGDGLAWQGYEGFLGAASDIQGMYGFVDGVTPPSAKYPSPTFTLSTTASDLFVDRASGNYRAAVALENAGYNGETPGADITTINTRTAHCTDGAWP